MTAMKAMGMATLCTVVLGLGMAPAATRADDKHAHDEGLQQGICVLLPTTGNKVRGRIVFMQRKDGVQIKGRVNNLTPGAHGFHIHEFGDLSDRTGKSAGGHYNPEGHEHGGLEDEKRHAGDLGNIEANDDGVAMVDKFAKGLKVHFILGRSVVVHGGEDDLKSQPSGNAGPRVAVGVIGVAQLTAKK